jgi:membrane protease subunit (stomatin/prohibitin family)
VATIDRVKWNASSDEVVWKFPSEDLSTLTQLIVNESQEAFLVRGGVFEGPFGAGRHTLSTENLPVLRSFLGIPFGGRSPFSAEVWFVNKIANLSVKWGTPDPIPLVDPKFGVLVNVRAFGQYGIQVVDGKKFLNKLVGTTESISTSFVSRYLNGELIKFIKSAIGEAIVANGVSVLEASTKLIEISQSTQIHLQAAAAVYGVSIPQFNVQSINTPEDDAGIQKLRQVLGTKAEMTLLGTNYQQMRSLDILQTAAGNEGAAGSLMTAGLGAGLGLGVGASMGNAMGVAATAMAPQAPSQASSPVDSSNRLRLLKELAELRNSGALTEDEFAAEKRRILL